MGSIRTERRREGRRRQSQKNKWKSYATAPGMLRFNNCVGKFPLSQRLSSRSFRPAAWIVQTSKKQLFGSPTPCDSRFSKPTLRFMAMPAPASHTMRGLADVLMDNPEMRFKGINHDTLDLAAKAALQVTDEVMVKWLHKWCPHMDFALIFDWIRSVDYVEDHYEHNLYMVPSEAMDIQGTGTTLAKLYRNCRQAYSKHSDLQVPNVVEISDHCTIVCRVLKNEKCADLLEKTKEVVQWAPLGLGCKELEVKKTLSRKLDQIPASHQDRKGLEKELLDAALVEYEIHRQEFTIQLMQQVKVLLDTSDPFHPDNSS
ncbi:uncharacterized protein F4812DRAFT_469289 [Daldinia caldariorum]|uniref:uncharacterized protein n=1 Tax=Daldinia caldariorum TaxID=326644 RepID=UPI0020073998|nr:uncharacterized protein F4812DRAFT_469289 [Daldinia caldariorum]KAI1470773.1 hypothetical protein F4812DRAFT_469289 [Daldinia caldariorum]